jgi:hypothetical protein
MAPARNDSCDEARDAVAEAEKALAENKADQRDRLDNALKSLNRLYKLLADKLGERDYKDIKVAARNLYHTAKTERKLDGWAKAMLDRKAAVVQDQDVAGSARSVASLVYQYIEAVDAQPGLERKLDEAREVLRQCESATGATIEGDTGMTTDDAYSGAVGGLCYAPRTGHGHVGEPCHVRVGKDGACQHHGQREGPMTA